MFGLHKFKSLAELEDSFIQYQDKTFSSWCLVNNCPRFCKYHNLFKKSVTLFQVIEKCVMCSTEV